MRAAPHTVGLKFWAHGEPLSRGGLLDDIAASLQTESGEAMIDRPTRTFGTLRRFAAADVYLSEFRPAYHALRPLRFVLECTVETGRCLLARTYPATWPARSFLL